MNGSELPFGISDFPMLSGYYYADKSFLIEEIVSSHLGKTILLTRPLHYGKTLNLSMLEHFFSIDRKDSSPLFDNLSISDNAALRKKHQNAHPVIRLDLGGEDFEEAIASSFHLEKRPIDELAPLCKERIHALVEGTGEKAILLVDDYDHPIQLTYLYGKYEETCHRFSSFYETLIKDNGDLLFCYLTGIHEYGDDLLFPHLDNLVHAGVRSSALSATCGLDASEAGEFISSFRAAFGMGEFEGFFGKLYLGGRQSAFSPSRLMRAIDGGLSENAYLDLAFSPLMGSLVKEVSPILHLIDNEEAKTDIAAPLDYRLIDKDPRQLIALLLQEGLLTYFIPGDSMDSTEASIYLPSEVDSAYFRLLLAGRRLSRQERRWAENIHGALLDSGEEDIGLFLKTINASIAEILSDGDKGRDDLLPFLRSVFLEFHDVDIGKGACCDFLIDVAPKPSPVPRVRFIFAIKFYSGEENIPDHRLMAGKIIERVIAEGGIIEEGIRETELIAISISDDGQYASKRQSIKP